MPTILIRRLALAAASCAVLAAGATPALARTRHHGVARHHPAASRRAAPASHAGIPQNANIENLNDLSLRRARAGQDTARPLAPPLAQ